MGINYFTPSVYIGPSDGSSSTALTIYTSEPLRLHATAINNHNQAVGYFRIERPFEIGATLYSNGQTTFLGSPFGTYAIANGINDAGTIVGTAIFSNCSVNCVTAARYSSGSWEILGALVGETPDGEGSQAFGINNIGQIIGNTTLASLPGIGTNQKGWLLDGNTSIDIPLPFAIPPNATYGMNPRVINNFGIVVGQSNLNQLGVPAVFVPFVYSGGQSYDLNALIAPNSGFTIIGAHDINDKGQILVQALGANNVYHSLRLDPTSDNPFPRTGNTPIVSLSSPSPDFGSVAVGSSKDRVWTVTNSGTGTLTGSATASGSFSVIAGAALSLTAGQSQDVTVRFAPLTAGVAASELLISTNAGNRSVPLSGTGSATPPPPAACASQVVPWTVGTSSCSATYAGGQSGTSAALSDIVAPDTGTVTASCTNGQLTLTTPVCVTAPPPPPPAACAAQIVPWTVDTSSCSATYAGGQSGTSAALTDIVVPDTGTVTASCTNGQLTLTAPVCVTAPPTKVEDKCSKSTITDFILAPFYSSTCDLIATLRHSAGFRITNADAGTDELFNWLRVGENENAVWALVDSLRLGRTVDAFLQHKDWNPDIGSSYLDGIKKAGNAVKFVGTLIFDNLEIGADNTAVQFGLGFVSAVDPILKFFKNYYAVATNLTTGGARRLLGIYIGIRCGEDTEPCDANQAGTLVEAGAEFRRDYSELVNVLVCTKGIFSCPTGTASSAQFSDYLNWLEVQYQAYRLTHYPVSSLKARVEIGKAIAKLSRGE